MMRQFLRQTILFVTFIPFFILIAFALIELGFRMLAGKEEKPGPLERLTEWLQGKVSELERSLR